MNDKTILSHGALSRGEAKAARHARLNEELAATRAKTEAELKANGWTERRDTYTPAPDRRVEQAFKQTMSRTYAQESSVREVEARVAYREFVKAGKFTTTEGRSAAARCLTTLGYDLSTAEDGVAYLKSDAAEARLG